MSNTAWYKKIGCLLPLAISLGMISWFIVGFQLNKYRNVEALKKFESLCNTEYFIDDDNREKWKDLEFLYKSGEIDHRDLSMRTYKNLNNQEDIVRPFSGSDRIFEKDIVVTLRNKEFLVMRGMILKNPEFIPGPLTTGFHEMDCLSFFLLGTTDHKYLRMVYGTEEEK